jgi:hypothetical protein
MEKLIDADAHIEEAKSVVARLPAKVVDTLNYALVSTALEHSGGLGQRVKQLEQRRYETGADYNHFHILSSNAAEAVLEQVVDRDMFVKLLGEVGKLCAIIGALEQRVIAIEALKPYRRTYRKGEQYLPGEFVTCAGSLWHCNAPTKTRPGSSSSWTLSVKKGDGG